MNPISRLLVLLPASFIATFVPHADAAKHSVRFDGLYCCPVPTNIGATTSCLRFYPDRTVLTVVSIGSPSDIAKWLMRQKEPNFRYTMKGDSLRFTQSGKPLSYVYSGTIGGDSIALRVRAIITVIPWDMSSVTTSLFLLLYIDCKPRPHHLTSQ